MSAASTILVFGVASALGQTQPVRAATARTYTAPRLPDGQPDIQGVWAGSNPGRLDATSLECGYEGNGTGHHENFTPPGPGEVQQSLDATIAKFGFLQKDGVWQRPCGAPSSSVYLGIVVPYQPWARAKKDEMFGKVFKPGATATSLQDLDPVTRCLPGMLNRTWGRIYQILQPRGRVVMVTDGHSRMIPIDGGPRRLGEQVHLWNGDSRGHWEGQTLTIESTNFNDKTWLDQVATFHSDALRVVERLTIVDADTFKYEMTFDDPKTLTKPFTVSNTGIRQKGDDYKFLEVECLEGTRLENYGIK